MLSLLDFEFWVSAGIPKVSLTLVSSMEGRFGWFVLAFGYEICADRAVVRGTKYFTS